MQPIQHILQLADCILYSELLLESICRLFLHVFFIYLDFFFKVLKFNFTPLKKCFAASVKTYFIIILLKQH